MEYTVFGYSVVSSLTTLWILWAMYVFTMGIYKAKLNGKLHKFTFILALPIVIPAVILDFLVNMTIASVIFLDPPRELLVTKRLQRYAKMSGWRKRLADAICSKTLDIFDPQENHC